MTDEIEVFKNIPIRNIATSLGIRMSDNGGLISCPSPSHPDKNPSFMIYEDTNTWHCFSRCGSGTNIDLVCLTHGIDSPKSEMTKYALDWGRENGFLERKPTHTYKSKARTSYMKPKPVIKKEPEKKRPDHSDIYTFLIDSMPFIEKGHYLERVRGLSLEVLRGNNIKAVEDGKNYKELLIKKFGETKVKEAGLLNTKDSFIFWGCNSVFPFYRDGRIVYLQGRGKAYKTKYMFLKGLDQEKIYTPNLKDKGPIYICEGIITALSFMTQELDSIGILSGSVCNNENALTSLLTPFKHRTIVLSPDLDSGAGVKAFYSLKKILKQNGFKVLSDFNVKEIGRKAGLSESKLLQVKDYNDLIMEMKKEVNLA